MAIHGTIDYADADRPLADRQIGCGRFHGGGRIHRFRHRQGDAGGDKLPDRAGIGMGHAGEAPDGNCQTIAPTHAKAVDKPAYSKQCHSRGNLERRAEMPEFTIAPAKFDLKRRFQ
jgi:hypothetical protein